MNDITKLFCELNNQDIKYIVLRGYLPIEDLFSSKDIDVFISKDDFQIAKSIFNSLGYKTPHINACNHPHIQFFKLTEFGLIKFDIVTDLCFGKKLMRYPQSNDLFKNSIKYEFIKVLPPEISIVVLCLHVCLDKGEISLENLERIKALKFLIADNDMLEVPSVFREIINFTETQSIELINRYIVEKAIPNILKNKYVVELPFSSFHIFKTYISCILRYRIHRLHRKSISIIGVDGSGKSSTIEKLAAILKEGCNVQYMGFRQMETKVGKEWYESGKQFKIKLKPYLGVYLEMWHRYLKYRFNKWRIILFDRFPWEAYDNSRGKYKPMYFVLFKLLFPKPKKVYYLYCSTETSFSRKTDITDTKLFIEMKNRFDKRYLNRKSFVSFNTDELDTERIVSEICKDIMKTDFYEYLF